MIRPGTSSMGKLLALSLVCTLAAAVLFQPVLMGKPREAAADDELEKNKLDDRSQISERDDGAEHVPAPIPSITNVKRRKKAS